MEVPYNNINDINACRMYGSLSSTLVRMWPTVYITFVLHI